MKANARFDPDTLRKLAGAKAFERGEDYHRDGSVEILSLTAKRVVAQVEGTEDYHAVLTGRGTEIGGQCSCPAFVEWGFCKHLVATALAANALGDDAEAEAAGALSRIRQYLKGKAIDCLVDMILERAEQDLELFRKLDMESTLVQGDDKTLEARLRKAIDGATRTRTYLDYQAAAPWRSGVDEVLDALEAIASGPRAKIALKLIEYAIESIEATFEAIDDSDGHFDELLQHARDIHVAAVDAVRPDPVALARNLYNREIRSDFGTFAGAVADYADVLGEQGLAEYRRLALAEWNRLPANSGRSGAVADPARSTHQLKGILDFFAEREGDVEFRIALRTRDLSSPWAYLQLVEFCMSQGREAEALQRAEEGLWLFEDRRPDERLLSFVVSVLNKAGRKADAEVHLWRAFQKEPSLGVYEELRKIGGEPAVGRALAILESRLSNNQRSSLRDLLLKILIREERFDAAWSTVHKFGVSMYARQALVEATDVKYPREALEFYTAQVEQLASTGLYEEVAKLIGRMAKLRSTTEQAAFVADLKARHGRKRNLMKLLG